MKLVVTADNMILFVSAILLFCIIFSRYLTRVGIPVLVFFIFAGMFLGSDGLGGVYFDEAHLAGNIGNIAICYILFAGGMATRWESIKEVLLPGTLLATAGVVITAVLVGAAAHFLVGLTLLEGLLLGSVVSCTDAASVFSILRSNGLNLKGSLAPLLELESSANDPAAYMMTISVLALMLSPEKGTLALVKMLLLQGSVGLVMGYVLGRVGSKIMERVRLSSEGLYPVVAVVIAAFIYSSVQIMHGNGFLGIYTAGIVMGNRPMKEKRATVRFFDGFSWLMQITAFLTLGLLVFPSQLPSVMVPGLIISAVLMFVVRPLAVFPILHFFDYSFKGKLLVSWVGFRGASSIVFAVYALTEGVAAGSTIFNLVFFISLTSVIIQGSMLRPIARFLGQLDDDDKSLVARTFTDYADEISGALYEMRVLSGSSAVGMLVKDLKFPQGARILIIQRENSGSITPSGVTMLQPGDKLMVTADSAEILLPVKARLGLG
ncbi:MAG: potassium/proton antiporter [Synergistaceae bacterium]